MADPEANEEFEVVEFSVKTRPAETSGGDDAEAPALASQAEDIFQISERFVTRLQLLWTYLTKIGTVAQMTSATNAATLLTLVGELSRERSRPHTERKAVAIADVTLKLMNQSGELKTESFSVPITDEKHLKTIGEHRRFKDAALRILHESAVQQLVNSFENLMADLVRRYILANTRAAAKDQTITYQELLEYGTLQEAQRRVTEVMVTAFIRGRNTTEHLQYLKKEMQVDVSSHFPEVNAFRELVLRRHAIVHAGGVATAEYLRRVREIPDAPEPPEEGKRLELEASYIAQNWERTYAMGVVMCHLAGQGEARRRSDKDQEEAIDYFLIGASYWAIEHRRFRAAELILRYASRLRLSKDTCQRMVSINLAQTYKWQGREDATREELDRHDWESASRLFRLAAEVLREGADTEKHMRGAVADGELSKEAVFSWPLFRKLREAAGFEDLVKRVFGDGNSGLSDDFAAAFLDFDYEQSLRRLARYGKERAAAKVESDVKVGETTNKGGSDPIVH